DGTIHARQVVVATGPFQRPRIPRFSEGVAPAVLQTDPTCYRALRTCRTAACSWSVAGRPAVRSATNCCERSAPCYSRFPGTGVSRGRFAARTHVVARPE